MYRYLLFIIFWIISINGLADNNAYKINAGDILEISVWKEEALQRELRVLPDGSISFPLAGVILVAGKTIKEIQTEFTKKLSEYITEPVVNITVKAVDGHVIYILGQVKAPGRFIMQQPMDIMQALSLAGGLTTFAKSNNIMILRRNKTTSEAIKFEYSDLESGVHLDRNYLLKSGDIIVVP